MIPFLKEIAAELYNLEGNDLSKLTVIFPNRRAGLFFRKYLSEIIAQPVWAPSILNIEDFIKKMSPLQVADKLTLIFILYNEYKKLNPAIESFDRFYSWGEILLKDFDEIDKYLINPDHLFTSLRQQKELENQFDYLSEEQIAVIKSFWASFKENTSSQQKDFFKIWNMLPLIFLNFKKNLKSQNLAYEGMVFREVVNGLSSNTIISPKQNLVFIGFNSLSPSEEFIIKHFVKNNAGSIYWDADPFYFNNSKHEAGYFLRKYSKDKVFRENFKVPSQSYFSGNNKNFELIGVPLAVGQAKKLGEKMLELTQEASAVDLTKTVVVLPEEHLLFPVLHSLPSTIENINITMGYPLRETTLYGFLEQLLNFKQHISTDASGKLLFYYKPLLSLLRHPVVLNYNASFAHHLIKEIEKKNQVYISQEAVNIEDNFFKEIFKKVEDGNIIIEHLINILLILKDQFNKKSEKEGENKDTPEEEIKYEYIQELEREYIYHFYTQLNRAKDILNRQQITLTLPTFLKIFRQIATTSRIPFAGEPLQGLQIMGALETRNLDFENVFILSMNEGAFPAKGAGISYVPYNLRKGFGLPTVEHQDINYSYTFYRLLQRAKNVFLFYNTEVGHNMNGELSRFIYQLLYETNFNIKSTILSNSIRSDLKQPITVQKTPDVLQILQKYLVKEDSFYRLTPSALNIYLDCRLKFYFRFIIGLKEQEEVQDKVDPMVFGNIMHLVLEQLYLEVMRSKNSDNIEKEDVQATYRQVDLALDEAFAFYFKRDKSAGFTYDGADIIAREIIKKYILKILELDKEYAPFQIVGLETNGSDEYVYDLPLENGPENTMVGIKGIIDRIDLKNGTIRVIDYKTGQDKKDFEDIPSLFDRNNGKRNKAAMQTFFYGFLYHSKYPDAEFHIMPALFNSKEMFIENFDYRLRVRNKEQKSDFYINDSRPFLKLFQEGLQKLVQEIFDPLVAFDQTSDLKKCDYCPYSGICHR
ncbi:PD-(D/E)XK nuclease family protein [soil metagenome]